MTNRKINIFLQVLLLLVISSMAIAECYKPLDPDFLNQHYFSDATFVNNEFLVLDNTGFMLNSVNGMDWSLHDVGKFHLSSVGWDGEYYLISGVKGSLLYSSDMQNWSEISLIPKNGAGFTSAKMYITKGKYFIASPSSDSLLFDMRFWGRAQNDRPTISSEHDVRYPSTSFFYGDSIFTLSSGEPIPAVRDVLRIKNEYLILTRDSGIYSSKDMITWSYLGGKMQSKGYARAFAYNGAVLVSVGDHGYINTSKDEGKNWTTHKLDTESDLYDVIWDGKQFIAVGNCGTVATSKNGVKWGVTSTNQPDFYTSIAYNGKTYVIVGAGAKVLQGDAAYSKVFSGSGVASSAGKIDSTMLRMFISHDAIHWQSYFDVVKSLYKSHKN